ncbi:MAG: hypothetical protein LV471_01455 [Nitrosomonas sp.]|nr:hypothetical protein [Nitrosomonas sp.]
MCFSAEASFLISGSLLVVGKAIIGKVKERNDYPVALIPLVFATQQIIEGLLWVSLAHHNLFLQFWLGNLYGVFVGIIWPLYAPLAIYFAETNDHRKKMIRLFAIAGFALSIYTVIALINQPVTVEIINQHIYYEHYVHAYPLIIPLYLLVTCVPFIFSSFRNLRLTGYIITLGFVVAFSVYTVTFVSVWCFFAAIASTLIFFHFAGSMQKPFSLFERK